MEFRRLSSSESADALSLAWRVFLEFDAPDFDKEGTAAFLNFIQDASQTAALSIYGAFVSKTLVGMLALRESHIALFFVEKDYQQQGIGRRLFLLALQACAARVTVHSSPYALPVYKALGFVETGHERICDGMRYTPMQYQNRGKEDFLHG